MKKIIGLLSAILMAAGLVAASGGPASADCGPSNYPRCVNTAVKIKAPNRLVNQYNVARIRVRVNAVGSNAEPRGRVKVVVRGNSDGEVYYRETKAYEGGKLVFITPELKFTGLYTATAKFKPTPGTVFNSSTGTDTFRVVPKG